MADAELVADAEADDEEAADADVEVTPEWRASERAINTPRAPTAS